MVGGVSNNNLVNTRMQRHNSMMSPTSVLSRQSHDTKNAAFSRNLSQQNMATSGRVTGVKHRNQKRAQLKSAAPTIAQSIRNKEKQLEDAYYASLKSCPMDMPRVIRFGSEGDSIEEIRL